MLKQLHIFIFICNFLSIKALRRIVGGRDVELGDFPYVGRWTRLVIYNEKEFWQQHCTCSFLSSSWAISAGHCLFDEALDTSIIMYGNVVHDQSPNHTKIIQTFGHPAHEIFNELLTRFDIALIKTHPVDLTVYGTLSAVDYTSLVGISFYVPHYSTYIPINVNKTLQVFKGCKPV
ncbi:unnamed protein product [Leptosia nina]|uniref:Peptidase S1 domain-containing protein n=1 Tax=Leptosia nina TaxID=320188 RepID=A0AAV1IZT7_9NEOP